MTPLRPLLAPAAVVLAAALLYLAARPASISPHELATLASRFRFERTLLQPVDTGATFKTVRQVNPALARISGWVSAVGAAGALADIEGTGRPADICLVDPRNDSVTVMPAPGTGRRFQPFALKLKTDGYDAATIAPMGCLPGDFNEDGRTDLLVYFWGRTPIVYLRQGAQALGPESFQPIEIVAQRERWFTNAALTTDVDGDGHPDLVFGDYFRDGFRILDPKAHDGAEMQHSMSRAYNGGRKHLLLWAKADAHGVTYQDRSDAFSERMTDGWTLAMGARDLNGDQRPEIYIANDFGPDHLLLNLSTPGHPAFRIVAGERDFTTPRSKVLGHDSFKGMGVDFGDVTGDGRPAIAVSNISAPYALIESHFLFVQTGNDQDWARGVAPYHDQSVPLGVWISDWGWDMRFADLDNDGRPELVQAIGFMRGERNRWPELQELAISNDELLKHPVAWPRFASGDDLSGHSHDRLYVRDARGRFEDIWPELGLDDGTVSRGIATADVCGDGRLSLLIARQWMPSVFLRNTSPRVGQSIELDLRTAGAVAGYRPLIDAVARTRLPDGRIVSDAVDGGSGHSGKRAPEAHLGLGDVAANRLFDVEILWRDQAGAHRSVIKLAPGVHRVVAGPRGLQEVASWPGSTVGVTCDS